MTPELQHQLDARISEVESVLIPQQMAHLGVYGKFQHMPWWVDSGWTGAGKLELSVTEYVGPSEIPEDQGIVKPGCNGLAMFTDVDGSVYFKSKDYGSQPSRNIDWIQQVTDSTVPA